jgi:diguanylate cyclase (GGDEF)-like protein
VAHSLLLFDLDQFKAVNDRYGHLVGDEVLRTIAGALSSRARSDDVLVRLGGDEFVVLAPGASAQAANDLAERMRAGLDAVAWHALAPGLEVNVSVGVSTTGAGVSLQDLVRVADLAMYASKNGTVGRSTATHAREDDGRVPVGGALTGVAEA